MDPDGNRPGRLSHLLAAAYLSPLTRFQLAWGDRSAGDLFRMDKIRTQIVWRTHPFR